MQFPFTEERYQADVFQRSKHRRYCNSGHASLKGYLQPLRFRYRTHRSGVHRSWAYPQPAYRLTVLTRAAEESLFETLVMSADSAQVGGGSQRVCHPDVSQRKTRMTSLSRQQLFSRGQRPFQEACERTKVLTKQGVSNRPEQQAGTRRGREPAQERTLPFPSVVAQESAES